MLSPGLAAQPRYQIGYYHDGRPIDLWRAGGLPFCLLPDYRDLSALANQGPYLFRITWPENTSTDSLSLLVENEHLDTLSLYRRQGDALVLVQQQGNRFPGRENFGYPEFRLSARAGEYYLLANFTKEVSFITRLDTYGHMGHWSTGTFFQLGLYYGVCLMFFMLNLCLGIYLKDRIFLYYCLFQLFIVAAIAYADGFFPLLTNAHWLLTNAEVLLHPGLALSGCLFALHFLDRAGSSRLLRICGAWSVVSLLFYGSSLVTNNYPLYLAGEITAFGLLGLLWFVAVRQFAGHVYARFFVVGYGVLLLFAADYWVFRKLGWTFLDIYPGQLKTGSVIEMLVLSLAIVFRVRALATENALYRNEIERHMQTIGDLRSRSNSHNKELLGRVQHRYGLSEREMEVLRGITEGLTNQQIAEKIFLSVHTVKFHTRNLFDKLEITNRTQALARLHE